MMTNFPPVSRSATSHPYLVNSLADLPAGLAEAARQTWSPEAQANAIFVVPPQSFPKGWWGRRYAPEQALIFTAEGVLHIQAGSDTGGLPQTTYLRAADLLYVELNLMLLYGRLEVVGQAGSDLTRVVVEFNTVAEYLLRPGLRQFLRLAWEPTRVEPPAGSVLEAAWRDLEALPLKFKNGLRFYGLQPEEQLLGVVFQPARWQRYWRFFRRQTMTTTLLALTDRQVILVTGDNTDQTTDYGWVFTFCPLAVLESSSAKNGDELRLGLARDRVSLDRFVPLETEQVSAWQRLWMAFMPNRIIF